MDWSYIAGYFDGEGHVGLHPNKRRKEEKTTKGMVTTLTWYNSHLPSLQAMHEFMRIGYIRPGNGGGYEGSRKQMYCLTISRKLDLLTAIDAMVPHLIVKREAALELRQYLIEHVDETRAKNFGKLLTIPEAEYRRWYEEEGKSLEAIAALLEATPAGVLRVFRTYGIARRSKGGLNKGKPKSAETRARMKAARAKLWADPEYAERMRAQLYLGHQGMRRKGIKKPSLQGEKHPHSKLSNAQTAEIREKYATGNYILDDLAEEYHVSQKTIFNIVHNKIRVVPPLRVSAATEVHTGEAVHHASPVGESTTAVMTQPSLFSEG